MRKQKLLDMLPAEFSGRHYLSKARFDVICKKLHWDIKNETLKRYLAEWREKGLIYSAGRGWYSDLPQAFSLYTEPLIEMSTFLKATFPLLDMILWSTRQLTVFYHHLPGKFHTFIYADRYSIRDIVSAIREKYPTWTVLGNPGKQESIRFIVNDNNIIVRPILYDDRKYAESDSFLHIENILVDFAIESEALSIVDGVEYSCIVDNIASSARIKPGVIIRRLTRRSVNNQYTDILWNYFQEEGEINQCQKKTKIDIS